MTPAALKALILSDSLAKQYASAGNDDAVAARCREIAAPERKLVASRDVKLAAIMGGYWAKMALAVADTTVPAEVRGLCITFRDWIDDPKIERFIDFDLPQVQAMLAGAVAADLITEEQVTELDNLANEQPAITVADVGLALADLRPGGKITEIV